MAIDDPNNNEPDFNDFDTGSDFEDFDGGKQSIGDLLKTNPMAKIGLVAAVVVVIGGGIALFGGPPEAPLAQSAVGSGSNIKQAPGTEKVTKEYEDAINDVNEQNVTDALKTGGSAIPVPIGPARGRVEVVNTPSAEDPLERWKRVQEERMKIEAATQAPPQRQQQQQQQAVDPYANERAALATSLQTQMESVLSAKGPQAARKIDVSPANYMEEIRARQLETQQALQQQQVAAAGASGVMAPEILQEAGQIEYGQLITEANTDAPGPVLAEIASGKLTGSRMLGSFTSTDDYLTLNFHTVIYQGTALATDAVAIDPGTSLPGMVTEIDRKYFQRIILPAAAAFIEGMGSAIADSGSTTVSAGQGTTQSSSNDLDTRQEFFKGVETAAEEFGEILDRDGSRVRPMLRLAAGTHMGVLFVAPVVKGAVAQGNRATQQQQQAQQQQQQQQQQGVPQLLLQLQPAMQQVPQGSNATTLFPMQTGNTATRQ